MYGVVFTQLIIDLMQCCSISFQEVENTSGWNKQRVTVKKRITIDGRQGKKEKCQVLRGKRKPATNFILHLYLFAA